MPEKLIVCSTDPLDLRAPAVAPPPPLQDLFSHNLGTKLQKPINSGSADRGSRSKRGRKMPSATLNLPIIDLSSPDRFSTAKLIRQACTEHGFFYLVNHGVEKELLQKVFEESRKFFSLPMEEKMKYPRKEHRGYNPLFAEKLDPTSGYKGDSKESFYIGPLGDPATAHLNQWPSKELLTNWRPTMESLYWKVYAAAKETLSLLALSLNLDDDFFEKIGALSSNNPEAFLRLLRYPGEMVPDEETYGAYAHSDYGMITLLLTDGVPGLQICKERSKHPQVWEDVPHIEGAIIVNIGDMTDRWTNCVYRSTLHRVMPTGKERYSTLWWNALKAAAANHLRPGSRQSAVQTILMSASSLHMDIKLLNNLTPEPLGCEASYKML